MAQPANKGITNMQIDANDEKTPHKTASHIEIVHNGRRKRARLELHYFGSEVKRVLKVDTIALQKKLGLPRRLVIDTVSVSDNMSQFIFEQRQLLEQYLTKGLVHAKVTAIDSTLKHNKPFSGEKMISKQQPVITTGKLVDFGWEKFPHDKGGQSNKAFFVDLEISSLNGAIQRLWGNDLSRALMESNAQPGDMLEIKHYGKVPVKVYDETGQEIKTGRKNLYNVTVLSSANKRSK
jgi:hypothetical protein